MAGLVECIISKGVREATAQEIADTIDPLNALEDQIYWFSKQQRQAAFAKARKQEAIKEMDRLLEGLDNPTPMQVGQALISLIGRASPTMVSGRSVESAVRRMTAIYHHNLYDLIAEFRTKPSRNLKDYFISGDVEKEKLLVRAIFGEDVGDPDIAAMAAKWHENVDQMRRDFNNAGGWIDKLEDWNLPQAWDPQRVRSQFKTPDEFVEFMLPHIDRSKMKARMLKKDKKGKLKNVKTDREMTEDEIKETLREVYTTITNEGHNKIDPMTPNPGHPGLTTKHNQERVIHLRNAESWIETHQRIGAGNTLFDMMMTHVDRMGTDVGTLQTLPPSAFETALAHALKRAGGNLPAGWEGFARAIYNNAAGRLTHGSGTQFAHIVQEAKNIITAGKLGGATLLAVADTAFSSATARYNGMSAMKVLSRHLSALFSGKSREEMIELAIQMGAGADAWVTAAHAHSRFGDTVMMGQTGALAQSVLRYSGLTAWTHSGRVAFQVEFMAHVGNQFGKTWDELPRKLRRNMEHYDIDAAKWDAFRAQGTHGEWKLPDMKTPEARDFHKMMMAETDFAVPTPDATVKAMTNLGAGASSAAGGIMRIATNLKTFPLTIMSTHWTRMLAQESMLDKATYGGMLIAHTTIMGAIAVYAREILSGKEPREIDDAEELMKLLGSGVIAGGSLGLAGDIFVANPFTYGDHGVGDKAMNMPAGGLLNDMSAILPYRMIFEDQELEEWGNDTIRAIRRNAPSVWWLRPATEMLGEGLERTLTEDTWKDRQRRAERRDKKEYGRGEWSDEAVEFILD